MSYVLYSTYTVVCQPHQKLRYIHYAYWYGFLRHSLFKEKLSSDADGILSLQLVSRQKPQKSLFYDDDVADQRIHHQRVLT
jgi:hypothetical protein